MRSTAFMAPNVRTVRILSTWKAYGDSVHDRGMRKAKTPELLSALRRRAGLSLRALAKDAGYKGASSIQRFVLPADFRGEFLDIEIAERFAKALVGRGEPAITEAEVYALAGPKGRAVAKTGKSIPVIDYVQAGNWTEVANPHAAGHGHAEMAIDSPCSPLTFGLEIKGTSMLDRFHEGDRIAIDPQIEPVPGDFVVAKERGNQEATFKQYRPRGMDGRGRLIVELRPLNDAWPLITLDAKNPGTIVGTMIEHHSYRRTR
jgi:SOS-response transcriptional repressor LexA